MQRWKLGMATVALSLSLASMAEANSAVFQQTLRSTAWVLSPIRTPAPGPQRTPGGVTPSKPGDREAADISQADNDIKVSLGSGVLIDARRKLLITNFHVVEERTDVVVFFP